MALPEWPRGEWKPGGGDALLYYMLFGTVPEEFKLDGPTYRCGGVPPGMALDEYDRATQPAPFEMIDEPVFAEALRAHGEDVFAAARASRQCVLLHGTVADPRSLNYLRDSVGLVQFMLDNGSVAVLDLQSIAWHTPESWRREIFGPAEPLPRRHVVILWSEDPDNPGRFWYHTRGLRKFGRPDVSVRNVPRECGDAAAEMCNRLIEQQAYGEIIEEGREVVMSGLPPGLTCRNGGDEDDPDFNNVHVEIRFPDALL